MKKNPKGAIKQQKNERDPLRKTLNLNRRRFKVLNRFLRARTLRKDWSQINKEGRSGQISRKSQKTKAIKKIHKKLKKE
jgi:hypothetical protein